MESKMNKKNNKCEDFMNQYLMLDKGERVPLKISLHLLGCKKCREQIKLLKLAEKEISAPLKIETPVTDASIQKVLSQVHVQQKDRFYKPLPFAGWIIGGILMITFLFSSLLSTQDIQNRSLSIWYALTIAGCVTVYCTVFVCSHIDLFIKKISTVAKRIS